MHLYRSGGEDAFDKYGCPVALLVAGHRTALRGIEREANPSERC
jgi:hypothetical protein